MSFLIYMKQALSNLFKPPVTTSYPLKPKHFLPGDRGRVFCIDDAGGIHINWDNGSSLAAIIGADVIRRIEEDKP